MRHGDAEMGRRGEFAIVCGFLRVAASPRPVSASSFLCNLRNLRMNAEMKT
jgi:hypothetical protein